MDAPERGLGAGFRAGLAVLPGAHLALFPAHRGAAVEAAGPREFAGGHLRVDAALAERDELLDFGAAEEAVCHRAAL